MDCTIPYDCPGHPCCNYTAADDTIIYENINEAMVSHTLRIEGSTEDFVENPTIQGFEDNVSSPYVSISCCHNDKDNYWNRGPILRNSHEYVNLIYNCNEGGNGCGDAVITMHRASH